MSYSDDPHSGHSLDDLHTVPNYTDHSHQKRSKKWWYIGIGTIVVIVAIAVGVSVSKKNSNEPFVGSASQIESLVKSNSPVGTSVFSDPNSYQSRALQWSQGNSGELGGDETRILQRYALACLYYATYQQRTLWTDYSFGDGQPILPWQNERGWLTFDDECDWFGLECNDEGLVEEIDLANNILTGAIPPEMALLASSLKVLDLYNNFVYNVGDEGNAFLGELTNMEQLYYGSTSFQYDGIPTYIGKLTNLVEYDCSYTLYFGELRSEVFENLNNLEYLYIGGNSFNSSIPTVLSELPNLLYFYAEYADVIGDLSFMIGMPQIFELWVDRNPKLTGQIYSEIGQLKTLESFSVTRCGLTGSLPTELGNLVNMQQMWFYANDLQGRVPTELGQLTDMKLFEIEMNRITGFMPTEVCANVLPFGRLGQLEADCLESGDDMVCSCCTCCGEQCANEQTQGQAGNAETDGTTPVRSTPVTNGSGQAIAYGGGSGSQAYGPSGTGGAYGGGGYGGGGQRRKKKLLL